LFNNNFTIFAIVINRKYNKVMSNNQEVKQRIVKGNKLACNVCKHDKFWSRTTLMNTSKMTFFKLDWANKSALNYICDNCGYVHWFMNK